jgi:hypothetical protein
MMQRDSIEKVRAVVLELIDDMDQRIERRPFSISSRLQPDIDQMLAGVTPMLERLALLDCGPDEFIWCVQHEIIALYVGIGYPRSDMERLAWHLAPQLKKML